MSDLAIIGGGPAALSAAIYAARAGLTVTVFEKQHFGGTLTEIAEIANYPGFTGPGANLATLLKDQAKAAGARLEYGTCTRVAESSTSGLIAAIDGEEVQSRAVLVATGSEPNRLDLATDKPISYCAICDGPLYKGKKALVIGGGNSAVGEALYLSGIASEVTLINRSSLRADLALQENLRAKPNVTIHENTQPTPELLAAADGIFVYIGKHPATDFMPPDTLNEEGYVQTDDNFMTTVPGLFAAGDVRVGTIKQAIVASAEGAAAALKISAYLENNH